MKKDRKLVIGDIHGGLRCLKQALERANFDKESDKLIFLGDYVDGWSESAELIQFLIDLQKDSVKDHIFLRGNHDKWCQDWLSKGQCPDNWKYQGGQATIDSYIKTGYLTSDEHRIFFNNLLNYYVDKKNRGFVHGGFISKKGIGHDVYETDYYWDRDLWTIAVILNGREHEANLNSKALRFNKHKEVYIGHTSTINWMNKKHYPEYLDDRQPKVGPITIPMNRCNVWNMDTGGGFKGKLSIMDINTKEYWQSDFVHFLYSDEKGR